MKSKKLVILLVAVTGIWGTIAFKIYQSLTDEPDSFQRTRQRAMQDSIHEGAYVLSLQYQDPFLKQTKPLERKQTPQKSTQVVQSQTVVVPQLVIDWSNVQYLGMVHNASRKKTTATIKIGPNEYFVKEGGLVEGFAVSEIKSDSVKLSFKNQSKFIKRVKN